MSFRVRVLLLVVLVALTAAGVTAWLTLRAASQQIAESQTVDRAHVDLITSRLRDYGERHGTWEGVDELVQELHARTGQRIHVVGESGTVLVDTDTLAGRTARPLGDSTHIIDPRPQVALNRLNPHNADTGVADRATVAAAAKNVATAIVDYRTGIRFAACLTRHRIEVAVTPGFLDLPQFAAARREDPANPAIGQCRASSLPEPGALDAALVQSSACTALVPAALPATAPALPTATPRTPQSTPEPAFACLARVFTQQISDIAPVPVFVYLGARDDPGFSLAIGPLLAAVAGVVLVVVLGTVLLSHRVLRPISTLTAAAHRLGRGDLDSRVPVRGNDELTELARSFNWMADSLQRGEERQRRLIADVAHELRTPLANLRGYLEALADGVIRPDPELFASLHEEAVLQQRIVNDLQDLALAEAGRLAYHRVQVDLVELLETCRTAHLARADSAGVALIVHAEPAGARAGTDPLVVHADPDRLRQVLGNLVTNALSACEPGGSVSLHAGRSAGGAEIRVVDTGIGIEPTALPYIFDRFWRADPARARHSGGGGGLGLAIARQIVTDHGGTITVESQMGVGTTFTITLPATGGTSP